MARDLREVLLEIRDKRGELTAEIVVEEATDPAHELHHRFEWEDSVAAHKYRLQQAGQLLRVTYKRSLPSGTTADLRAFWVTHRKGDPTPRYEPIEEVLMDPVERAILLRQMERDWKTFKARYQHMEEFAALIAGGGTT